MNSAQGGIEKKYGDPKARLRTNFLKMRRAADIRRLLFAEFLQRICVLMTQSGHFELFSRRYSPWCICTRCDLTPNNVDVTAQIV